MDEAPVQDRALIQAIAAVIYEQFGAEHREPRDVSLQEAKILAEDAVSKWRNMLRKGVYKL